MAIDLLRALYDRLYPTYISSIGQRRETCLEGLPFTYAQNENALTKANARLMADREIVYKGQKYLCEPHLKVHKDDIRVYFTYAEEHQKILIASIGLHKDTAGTTRRGH